MKKSILLCLLVIFSATMTFIKPVSALDYNKIVYVHYYKEDGYIDRTPTYTNIKNVLGKRFGVQGFNAVGSSVIESQLKSGVMLFVHNHGAPGLQYLGKKSEKSAIVGKNGSGGIKSVSSMSGNATKKLGIAVYFGCKTGQTGGSYGDLAQETVNKFAKSSIAWNRDTDIRHVNDWSLYFSEYAEKYNPSIADTIRNADTRTKSKWGASANYITENKIERGSFSWHMNDL